MTDIAEVAWDIDTILSGRTPDELFDEADAAAAKIATLRGQVGH